MKKEELPKTPTKIIVAWRDGERTLAITTEDNWIKLWIWDGIAKFWNEFYTFEQIK